MASALIVAVGAFVFLWLITAIVDVVEMPPPPSTAITVTNWELHAELWPVVADYVRQKHGWSEDMYRIEFDKEEGPALAFTVHYRDDDKLPAYPGSGKSFEIIVDPSERQVTRETYLRVTSCSVHGHRPDDRFRENLPFAGEARTGKG